MNRFIKRSAIILQVYWTALPATLCSFDIEHFTHRLSPLWCIVLKIFTDKGKGQALIEIHQLGEGKKGKYEYELNNIHILMDK